MFACGKYGLSDHSIALETINDPENLSPFSPKVDLLASLADNGNVTGINMFFDKNWVLNTLDSFGFKPGKASVNIKGGNSGDFFYGNDNRLHTISGAQSRIRAINVTNYLELGVSRDSIWKIDGKQYSMNESGYFNIPMDAMCVPGSMDFVDKDGNPVVIHA